MIASRHSTIRIEEITDPTELAKADELSRQFERNSSWLKTHAADIFTAQRGKHVCVAGQELFVADTAEEALALAQAAHPEDQGILLRYIPQEKVPRIYAHQRRMVSL